MRSTFTGRLLERWFFTASVATVVACVVMFVTPVKQPLMLAGSILVSSLAISAWMEWVQTRRVAQRKLR